MPESTDTIDELFSGFYPGSKVPIPAEVSRVAASTKRRTELTEALSPATWGSPVLKRIGGQPIMLYSIGGLARALGRTVSSLRAWESDGRLPRAPFALAGMVGPRGGTCSRRYYSELSITNAVELFEAAGFYDRPRIDWNSTEAEEFTTELTRRWQEEQASYTANN